MSILSFAGLAQSFGAFDVFSGLNASLPQDARAGLVGANGIGKTTLLRILAGLDQPTRGSLRLARGRRIGYLRQEAVQAFAARDNSVYAEMLTVFAGLAAQQERLHAMEAAMAAGDHSSQLLERYGQAQEQFGLAGGYDYEVRIQQTLTGLGFGPAQWATPLRHLSGGQKTRALLARLLLEGPDLLILDEPTNHLDATAVEWLEQALRQWPGALLVVSHDRYFLDNVTNTIWEMHRDGLEVYTGNYSAYLQQRAERWQRQQALFESHSARLRDELAFIQRGYARESMHNIAQGKLRRLSRELAAINLLGLEQAVASSKSWMQLGVGAVRPLTISEAAQALRALQPPRRQPPQMRLSLSGPPAGASLALQARGLRVGFPGTLLVEAGDLQLLAGECAAVLGPNGAGKTTLLRTLLGELQPLAGTISLGPKVRPGYLAQAHEGLDPQRTVLDTLLGASPMPVEKARSFLAQYLFQQDDVFKPAGALSGGERSRLALALLALEGANLLLLDEPTNHLDLPAQEALQAALEAFPGTILLVSHDRYLVDRLATQIWEVRAGQMDVFRGTYAQRRAGLEGGGRTLAAESARPNGARPGRPGGRPATGKGTRNPQSAIRP
jgi:ATP-binding cassette, subfamily F, member 3